MGDTRISQARPAESYRADVDGLRAVAVLPVVFYHYGIVPFSGGYVGVDIFFVISGYLITSLIYAEMRLGRFSVLNFYERRVRRIFPALMTLLLVTTVAASLLLSPHDLRAFAKSLLATVFFSSNLEFWREAGYFDAAAETKPLLHTWSLAVEEQFYVVFPAILYLLRRIDREGMTWLFAAGLFASLALSIWSLGGHPSAAFYLAPMRFWELLLGAVLAVGNMPAIKGAIIRNLVAAFGLMLIVLPVLLYGPETPFPGTAAIPPCLGAALLIYTGSPGSGSTLIAKALALRPIVFIGLISYSLYLWHWPLLVFAKYNSLGDLSPYQTAALIVLSVMLATLSWRYVELPFRRAPRVLSRPKLFAAAGTVMVAVTGLGAVIFAGDGWPQRFPPDVARLYATADEGLGVKTGCSLRTIGGHQAINVCHIGANDGQDPSFVIWGDSHAGALTGGFDMEAKRLRLAGLSVWHSACAPLLGVSRLDQIHKVACAPHNDAALDYIRSLKTVRTVILAGRWALLAEGLRPPGEAGTIAVLSDAESKEQSVEENKRVLARSLDRTVGVLQSARFRVAIISEIPEPGMPVPETLAYRQLHNLSWEIGPTLAGVTQRQRFVLELMLHIAHTREVDIFYPNQYFCGTQRCMLAQDGKPLYIDDDHLSHWGAFLLATAFAPLLVRDDDLRCGAPARPGC